MSNKNQQMKIALVAVLVILLISSIIAAVRSSSSQEPVPVKKQVDVVVPEDVPTQFEDRDEELDSDSDLEEDMSVMTQDVAVMSSQDVAAKKELVKAVEDLETIKDRIKNVEEYSHREKYRSETNNGLTVVGTLMEQMIDVMVAVLKQPLVSEAVSKRIVNKQDADEIAEYIEMLGQEVVKEVEQTQLLRCGRPMVRKTREENGGVSSWMEEGDGEVPEDNCEVYKFNQDKVQEGINRAAANLYNKVLSVVEKAEERDKMYRIVKNVSIDNYKQLQLSYGREISEARIEDFPEQSKLENIAMAHYKYLGHDLKKELGESINIRELTEDEERYVRYLKRRNPSRSVERPSRSVERPSRSVERPSRSVERPVIPFFTNPNGSVKGINQLTDGEYETIRKFYNRFDPDGYKHTDYPNRHKHRYIREKINFLKEKPIMYSFLPGHEYSHNMNLSKGDNTFAERQQQLTQKGLTDEQILSWMDGWYRYSKKHKKIKLGGGQVVDEDDYQDIFPFYTLSINEIVNLVKDMKEQIEKDQKTRMNFHMYNFDDRNNQKVEGYRI
jgi:hypothetical protein